jgi:cell wall-associated NlpC family hydrolase
LVVDVDIVTLARSFIGTSKYRLGVTPEEAPHTVDCSSFTKYLYAQKGVWIPRLSIQQREAGIETEIISPGDLIFTTGKNNLHNTDPKDNVGHVGIATAGGTVIHASYRSNGVTESSYEEFISGNPRGIRKVVNEMTITLECPRPIETSDDLRWFVVKRLN